ncbi:hypothetical protein D3C80_1457550 [compost metagenome]
MDMTQDTVRVTVMPISTMPISTRAVEKVRSAPVEAAPTMNMEASRIRVGHRPLHGTKLLVRIASIRSLGDSMMRVERMAAALQPKPIDIVKACLPWPPDFLNRRSMLKATRGR